MIVLVLLMNTWLSLSLAAAVPCLQTGFKRAFIPANGRYLNDHTLIYKKTRLGKGLWHLFGITHTSQGAAFEEKSLLHATAPQLNGPWTEHEDALQASPALDELVTWAPHVVEWEPGQWLMYYWAEWLSPPQDLWRGLRRADSSDLFHWSKQERVPDPTIRPPGGRDPYLLRMKGRALLYSVGVDAQSHGQIIVTEPLDALHLTRWTEPIAVITDPDAIFGWGNLESPFVEYHGGTYYLFLTRTGPNEPSEYLRELVFQSDDPFHFEWKPVAEFQAHASEIVHENGKTYITSGGWTSVIGEQNRGLKIARLQWVSGGTCESARKP